MKLSIAVFLTTVLATSTVHGKKPLSIQEILEHLMQQERKESSNLHMLNETALLQQEPIEGDNVNMEDYAVTNEMLEHIV